MTNPFEDEEGDYLVLVNGEEQYSLWPSFHEIPVGWRATGPRGARAECLAWIDATWTDMRPRACVTRWSATPPSAPRRTRRRRTAVRPRGLAPRPTRPGMIGDIAKAALVLVQFEHKMIS